MSIKLKLAIALALSAPTFSAFGLGLGEIHTRSALNQKFDAQIDLLSVQPEELENIRVKLAPRETYERIGLDRPALLRSLRFSTAQIGKRSVITVKSDKLIREPFLDFLIEVHWPTGKIIREYTVLLDPPIVLNQQATGPVKTVDSTTTPVAPTPLPASTAASTTTYSAQRSVRPAIAASTEKPVQLIGDQYGPVESGESLSRIAASIRHQDTTISQMTNALWKANPDAFIRNNINLLKAGSTLRVPSKEETVQLNKAVIRNQSAQQKADTSPAETGQADTPKEEQVTVNDDYRLKLVTNDQDIKMSSVGDDKLSLSELKNQLQMINEKVESYRIQNETLRDRVRDLTDQLSTTQQEASEANDKPQQTVVASVSPDTVSVKDNQITAEDNNPAAVNSAEASSPITAAASSERADDNVNTFDSLLDKAWWLLGFLVLGLSAWLGLSRQNKENFEPPAPDTARPETPEEPIAESEHDEIEAVSKTVQTPARVSANDNDSTTIEGQDEEDHDLVAEAEQCLAYGHHDLAESLLKQAIEQQDNKTALRYKLIDIYYAKRDVVALNEMIDQIESSGDEDVDREAWDRAMELSVELASESKPSEAEVEPFSLEGETDSIDPNWLFEEDDTKNAGNDDIAAEDSQADDADTPQLKIIAGRQK